MTKGFIVRPNDDSVNFYRVSTSCSDKFYHYERDAQIESRLNGGEIFFCEKGYFFDKFFNEFIPSSEEEAFPRFPLGKQLPYFSIL